MKPAQLIRRIEELSEKLKPVPSEGIRIDFYSFTQPEQLVLLKNAELEEKYRYGWTDEAVRENINIILKGNQIVMERVTELFEFIIPRALMLDEIEQWYFRVQFNDFWKRFFECQENVSRWPEKEREDFLRLIRPKSEPEKRKREARA
jgi:hypothetical protein